MKLLPLLPVLIPLLTAALALLQWRHRVAQRRLSVAGAVALFAAAAWLFAAVSGGGVQVVQLGGWQAPFGISFVADTFSSLLVLFAATTNLCVVAYSLVSIDARREAFGYHALLHVLLMGVCGAFLTGDIFNLYVWFELMLMASFVLLALGGGRRQMEGAIKYVTINLISSALFLAAIGLLYAATGTLNMADLALKAQGVNPSGMRTIIALLFFVAFGVKAALFPLYFWLPASYHTPPVVITAIFAGLLTKVGVYSLARVFTLVFRDDAGYVQPLLLWAAALTMIAGGVGAIVQRDLRRMLSFLIISHIGVAAMGLGIFTARAFAGMIFYLVEDIVVLTNLFLIAGGVRLLCGTYDLTRAGGIYRRRPVFGLLFLIPALSLSGIPPFSGFFAKLALIQAGLEAGRYWVVAVSLSVSLLTLYAMARVWMLAFWREQPAATPTNLAAPLETLPAPATTPVTPIDPRRARRALVPVAALSLLTVALGLGAEYVFRQSLTAAAVLAEPRLYVEAVLGGER